MLDTANSRFGYHGVILIFLCWFNMNFRYFACMDCKLYTDAGYRWAYWTLENPGIVHTDTAVDVSNVLSTSAYWNPPQDDKSSWLCETIFPLVRAFFNNHHGHKVVYVESGSLFGIDNFDEWVETMSPRN